jgi:hypothetical protein
MKRFMVKVKIGGMVYKVVIPAYTAVGALDTFKARYKQLMEVVHFQWIIINSSIFLNVRK